MPQFDEKYFLFGFDEEHPEVEIPAEVPDDVDNDWDLPQERKEDEIQAYV